MSSPAGDYDIEQLTVYLPADFAKHFQPRFLAEFEPIANGILKLEIVDPKATPRGKRYRITRHHGSFRISIPRWWLRDRGAKAADLVVAMATTTPGVALLELQKV